MKALFQIAKEHRFQPDETIFQLHQSAKNIYRVVSGEVHLYRLDSQGNRILIFRAYRGDFFAEASLHADQYHCYAICVNASIIQSFNTQKVLNLLHKDQEFALSWIKRLSIELRVQRTTAERLHLKSASDRIIHYVRTEGNALGEIHIKGTLTEIADVLGLTRETLYRTLASMEKQNIIERADNILRII